jgi:hypothetical protein
VIHVATPCDEHGVYVTKDMALASDSSLSSLPMWGVGESGCLPINGHCANSMAMRQLRVGANSSLIKFLELQAQHGRGVQKRHCRCAMAVLAFGNRG